MATTYQYRGDKISWENDTGDDVSSGEVVKAGRLVGVALEDIPEDATGTVAVSGVFELAKDPNREWNQGEALSWDDSEVRFDTESNMSGEYSAGDVENCASAAEDAENDAETGMVLLHPGRGELHT